MFFIVLIVLLKSKPISVCYRKFRLIKTFLDKILLYICNVAQKRATLQISFSHSKCDK